ncbi:SPW repeat protein [Microvirga sp. P5_D2]
MVRLKQRNDLSAISIVNALLAAFLFFSPWLIGFTESESAFWNAWVCGPLIGILAITAINALYEWEEWSNATLGLWVLVAPWVLGFSYVTEALWTHVGVGLAITVLAVVELWILRRGGLSSNVTYHLSAAGSRSAWRWRNQRQIGNVGAIQEWLQW